jgi:hypothetical protein
MSYLGNPASEAVGQKARQMRAQAASTGTPAPPTDSRLIGRASVGAEPHKVRSAQGHQSYSRKKGNA